MKTLKQKMIVSLLAVTLLFVGSAQAIPQTDHGGVATIAMHDVVSSATVAPEVKEHYKIEAQEYIGAVAAKFNFGSQVLFFAAFGILIAYFINWVRSWRFNPKLAFSLSLLGIISAFAAFGSPSELSLAEIAPIVTLSGATAKQLIEKRLKIHAQMEDVVKQVGTDDWNDDKQKQFDGWDKEFNDLTKQIDMLNKVEARKAGAAISEGREIEEGGAATKATRSQMRKVWTRAKQVGMDKLDSEEKAIYKQTKAYNAAFEAYVRFGFANCTEQEKALLSDGYVDMSGRKFQDQAQARALGLTASAGGYLVAEDFMAELEKFMLYYGGILEACRVVRTGSGADMPWPTNNDTANKGRLLAEAGDSSSGATDLTYGSVTLKAYNYTSDLIKVARVLLQDNTVPVESHLPEALAERLGRILNEHCTTGDNSSKPQGVTVGASQGKVTTSATAFTRPELVDLIHSVNRAYRKSPKTGFMFHDNILAAIKKLALGTGDARPLWQPSMREGEPDKLEGFQYWVNDDMASSIATGNKTMLFGDFNKYIVRIVSDVEILRLNERYAEAHQVAFVGFQRFDGRIINSAAIKYLEQT